MTTAYTSLLGLALPVTGELSGTWGSTVNTEITALLDSAIAGTTTLSTDADVTLTTTTGAANTSRQAILLCSGARTVLRTITAPAQSKIYTIINATTGGFSVKLVGAGPTTGVTIVAGESAVCAWNGSDFIKISNTAGVGTFTNLTVTGTLGVTGVATLGNGAVLGTPASGTVTNLTGTASININGTVGATTAAAGAFTTLSATGVTTVQAGTAALPAITTTGDTNTGIFFPAADTIAFSEGGVEAARFDSAGNLGLGVTPSAWYNVVTALQVKDASIYSTTNTANFSANEFVNSSAQNIYKNTGFASLYAQNNGSHKFYNAASGTAGNVITFTQAMTLDASGNLGLGATSITPRDSGARTLELYGTSSGRAAIKFTNSTSGTGATDGMFLGYDDQLNFALNNNEAGYISFATSNTERARIDSSGNVGIGTTAPAVKLDINGITGWQGGTTGQAAQIVGANSGVNGGSNLRVLSNTTQAADVGGSISLGGYYTSTTASIDYAQIIGAKENSTSGNAAGYMVFGTRPAGLNMAERMRIDSSGNLGLGVTPSAWDSTYKAIQVGARSMFFGVGSEANMANNAYYNAGYKYVATSAAGLYTIDANVHKWYTAPSGTAGNAISFTQAMTLDASGNVGIGTSSPSSFGSPLSVYFQLIQHFP